MSALRGILVAAALLAAGGAWAAEEEKAPVTAGSEASAAADGATVVHTRGEYRFSIGPVPAFVTRREVPATWDSEIGRAPGDPWRGWLYDRQVDLRGGRRVEFAERAYEARTTSMLGGVGRLELDFNPLYQTLTLHALDIRRDGVWLDRLDPARFELMRRETGFDDDKSDGRVSALMIVEDVRVGDVVRVAFTIDGDNPVLGGHVLAQWATATTVPMLRRHVRALFDPDAEVEVKARGTADADAVVRRRTADAVELEHLQSGVAPIVDTGDYPAWYTPYPLLQFSERRRWSEVVDWARPLYPPDAPLPPELQEKVRGWKALPKVDAVAAALRVAQEDIRYFAVALGDNTHRPNLPAVVWARRYGDCKDKALLLVAMLRELGVEAVPALVSYEEGAALRESLPAANAFDHVIVRATVDGRVLWLDATLTQQRGPLLARDVHPFGFALPIAPGVGALEAVAPPADVESRVLVTETFTPASEGDAVELEVVTDYTGQRAVSLRHEVHARRFERIAEGYADYYRRRYGEVEVLAPASIKDDEAANTIRTVERYRLRDPWQGDGERVIALSAVPLADAVELPAAMRRDAPIALEGRGVRRYEAKVVVPEGWLPGGTLGVAEYEGGPVSYRREVVRGAKEVSVMQELRTTADHVAAADVPRYVDALRSTRGETALRVVLTPAASTRRDERADRLEALLRDSLEGN